jgi:hypothetical protein
MGQHEPPSTQRSPSLFMIGRDSHGHWVVQDQNGLHGGLFVDRTQALKFALFENGNRPQAVVMVPGTLELNIAGIVQPGRAALISNQLNSNQPLERRAA